MDCKEAQHLSILHILGDLASDSTKALELDAHLLSCQVCAEKYEGSKQTIEFIKAHKDEFVEALESLERQKTAEQEEIKRGWQVIQTKPAQIEAQKKQAKFFKALWRITSTENQPIYKIYQDYKSMVSYYLFSRNSRKDEESIDDMTQEVFVRFWKNRQQYDGRSSAMTYLIGIANNVLADESKLLAREAKFLSDTLLKRLSKNPTTLADPQLRAYRAELISEVTEAIARLTEEQKHAIRLIYYEGLSLIEAAQQADCSVEAFKGRLSRARRELCHLLGHLKPR